MPLLIYLFLEIFKIDIIYLNSSYTLTFYIQNKYVLFLSFIMYVQFLIYLLL